MENHIDHNTALLQGDEKPVERKERWKWKGRCQACDSWIRVNDLGLCEECDITVQRDLIRAPDRDYVTAAFGLDDKDRERLRTEVIHQYGAAHKLIIDPRAERQRRTKE